MKTIGPILSLLILSIFACQAHGGIRCSNDLISIGDTSMEVRIKLKNCGEILDKQVIQKDYVQHNNHDKTIQEQLIEQWYIRVNERGGSYCYPLTFKGGKLNDIGRWGKCN